MGTFYIHRYRVLRKIGEGAMGVVYLAEDPIIQREVAIKVFKIEGPQEDRENHVKRFLAEAKVIGRLKHPNIVAIFDAGITKNGEPYLVMEFVEGKPLSKFLAEGYEFPIEVVCQYMIKLLDALHYAHKQGVVHRDIKPGNIMITSENEPVLMDFGIAKSLEQSTATQLTQSGMIIGTPGYMSPEQVSGRKLDGRSDLFSIGIVLWESLTLRKAFHAESLASIAFKIVYEDLPPASVYNPHVPYSLDKIISRALAKDPIDRYQSALEFKEALEQFLISPRSTTVTEKLVLSMKRHPFGYTFLLAGTIVFLVMGFILMRKPNLLSRATEKKTLSPPILVKKIPFSTSEERWTIPSELKSPPSFQQSRKKIRPRQTQQQPSPKPQPASPPPIPTEKPGTPSAGENVPSQQAPKLLAYLTVDPQYYTVDVYLDDEYIGRSPIIRRPVKAGSHRIRILGPQPNQVFEKQVFFTLNTEYNVPVHFKVFAKLIIDINKPATVYIDGKRVGSGKLTRVVQVGRHKIRLIWQNKPVEREVIVGYPQEVFRYFFPD